MFSAFAELSGRHAFIAVGGLKHLNPSPDRFDNSLFMILSGCISIGLVPGPITSTGRRAVLFKKEERAGATH